MLTRIDKSGRIKIPKEFCKHLGINHETKLNISEDDRRIVIEPVKEKAPVIDRDGILVFTGKLESKRSSLIKSDRNKRMQSLRLVISR